jgi:MFS transporter, DHA1 family, inner membrane transport protein
LGVPATVGPLISKFGVRRPGAGPVGRGVGAPGADPCRLEEREAAAGGGGRRLARFQAPMHRSVQRRDWNWFRGCVDRLSDGVANDLEGTLLQGEWEMADSSSRAGCRPEQNKDWLVGSPSGAGTTAALWIGSTGLLILGVIPILYGALHAEKRINLDQLGLIATLETVLIGVGSVVAAKLFSARNLRLKCTILLVALGALSYAISIAGSPNMILIDRVLAGLVEGAMVAVSIELIARSRHAERLGGFFLAIQALAQGLLALGLAWWVVPGLGANGGFLALGIVCVVSIGAALLVPTEYGDMPKQSASMDGVFTVRAMCALLMIVLFFMFVVAVWTFLEPLGGKVGIDAQTVGVLVSIGLFVQVAASLAAAWLEAYIDYRLGIIGCGVVGLIALMILGTSPTLLMFCVAVLTISFVWMFIVPFMISMTLAADSTRNTVLLVPAAQLLGAALGPLAATAFVDRENVSAVPIFGIAMTVFSLALFGLFLIAVRRRAAA